MAAGCCGPGDLRIDHLIPVAHNVQGAKTVEMGEDRQRQHRDANAIGPRPARWRLCYRWHMRRGFEMIQCCRDRMSERILESPHSLIEENRFCQTGTDKAAILTPIQRQPHRETADTQHPLNWHRSLD